MLKIIRTSSSDEAFRNLVRLLDQELAVIDGEDHKFYSQFNKIEKIRYAVVALDDEKPVGCGAIKEFGTQAMEVKRMFVSSDARKKGIASEILKELEKWSAELTCKKCVLETGKRQQDAIALYTKNGYRQIPNYGQYVGVDNSVCFEKEL